MPRAVLLSLVLLLGSSLMSAQPSSPDGGVSSAPAAERSVAEIEGEHGVGAEGEVHHETIWGPISRAFNSLVLFGVLYYFLRKPTANYLAERDQQIRNDLVTAAAMKQTATAQLADLEQRMAALPSELNALRTRGQEEIAAEEARIEQAAAAERERLLQQMRYEIDLQLRLAKRELVEHASSLAVTLATERIEQTITPDDQRRLVDRYLEQVKL